MAGSDSGSDSHSPTSPTSLTAAGKRPDRNDEDHPKLTFLLSESHFSNNPRGAFLSTSSLDLASPPYRPEASTANLPTGYFHPSPAYRSQVNMDVEPKAEYPDIEPIPVVDSSKKEINNSDDEGDNSDYDWSGEDDLVDQEAKLVGANSKAHNRRGWGIKRIITFLFSSLIGSTLIAGILVTPGILLHFYWYETDPSAHRKYVEKTVQAWLFWLAANVLLSWYLAIIVDLIPIVVTFAIAAAWGHVSEHVTSRVELYNGVKNTVKPVLYAASGWVSWIIVFGHVFGLYDTEDGAKSEAGYAQRVYEVIEFLFFLVLVICAQKMLSHVIAFGFHKTAYKERLDTVQNTLRVVEQLRNYRPKHGHANGHSNAGKSNSWTPRWGTPVLEKAGFQFGFHSKHDRNAEEGSSAHRHRYPPASASPRPSIDTPGAAAVAADTLAAAAKAVKSAVLHDARNIGGESDDPTETSGGVPALGFRTVGSSAEAKRLARAIYQKFRPSPSHGHRTRTYLLPTDFNPAFPTSAQALSAFRVFDTNNNGDLSRAEIKTTLLRVYRERRALVRSMRDVSVAMKSLDRALLGVALLILFFIALSVFGVNIDSSLTSVYTLVVGASFIFKASAANAFDAVMFLFVTHPYDTGDRCFIDDENLIVKRMGLFATLFTRVDGTETYYFNSQLFSKFITNVRRSGDMYENVTLQIDWRTPIAKLDALEKSLNNWLATEENRWFIPSTSILLQSINYQRYLEITIGIGHNGTWQDWGLRCSRKTAFHAAVQHYTRQLGIVYFESPVPFVNYNPELYLATYPNNTMNPDASNSNWQFPSSPGGYTGDVEVEEMKQEEQEKLVPGTEEGGRVGNDENELDGVSNIEGPGTSIRPTLIVGSSGNSSGSGLKSNSNGLGSGVTTALGFTPPEGFDGGSQKQHLRARKTKGKKDVMTGLAGDG